MKKRNEAIDAVKGFAILLVMIGHVLVHNNMEDPYLYNLIKVIQMPLFICISGYINGCGRKISNGKELYTKLLKRSISYLLPFFTWIILLHLNDIPIAVIRTLNQLERGLWFLMTLFVLMVMTSLAEFVKYQFYEKSRFKSEVLFLVAFAGLTCLLLLQYISGSAFLSPSLTVYYLPFYFAGYYIAEHKEFIQEFIHKCKVEKALPNVLFVLSGIAFFGSVIGIRFNTISNRTVLVMQIMTAFFGCYFFMYLFSVIRENKVKHLFSFLGQYTLEIYVLHFHFADILNFSHTSYDLYSLKGSLYAVISFVVMSAITAALIVVIKKIPVLDLLLFGKRQRKKASITNCNS